MTAIEEKCLLVIVEAAMKTEDLYVLHVELPVTSLDVRNSVVHSLENKGYISHLNIMGQTAIGCQVEEKALEYALNYCEKR